MKIKIIIISIFILCMTVSTIGCVNATDKIGTTKETTNEKFRQNDIKVGETLFNFYNDKEISAFADNFYNNMPQKAIITYGGWGNKVIELTKPAEITALFEKMKKTQVVKETNVRVTDSDYWIEFIMPDSKIFYFAFEQRYLNYKGVNYIISNRLP